MDTVAKDRTARHRLHRMLAPKSIVVMGGREAGRVIRQCDRLGFNGEIWPVNPNREALEGRPCFASLEDLPGVPDAAFIAIPRELTIEAVAHLSAMGAGGAVCYASGFAETGPDGAEQQQVLVDAAGDMPIIGPNCYGCLNTLDGVALWPDNHGLEPQGTGAAILTQSGNMGINFTMSRRGLPLACLMSLGNQAAIGITDCLDALLEDDRIRAIGLHIEGIDDLERFSRAAIRACEKGVPIVAFKTGRSEKGAHATVSHTSTLAGSDRLYDALFQRLGIARVHSITAFLETLKLLCVFGPLKGNRIASLSCSGGEASLMADAAERAGLVFPDLAPDLAARLRATLNEFVDITNPLDYHTFIWGDRPGMEATFGAMMSGGFDCTLLLLDHPTNDGAGVDDWHMAVEVFAEAAIANDAHAAVLATLPECVNEETAKALMARGVALLVGVDDALTAIATAAEIGATQRRAPAAPLQPVKSSAGEPVALDEAESKRLLSEAGVPVPEGRRVAPGNAVEAANQIGFPVALKALGAGIAHKTELGAVALDLRTPEQVADAARALAAHAPELLVERMVEGAVCELIIGIARDAQFGPHLVIGAGGILVELVKDATTLLLPTTRGDIERALSGLKIAPLMQGFRGRPKADIGAAVDAAWAVARFSQDNRDAIEELDINPLIVCEEGKGAVAADALIVFRQGDDT